MREKGKKRDVDRQTDIKCVFIHEYKKIKINDEYPFFVLSKVKKILRLFGG
jgi:hypothetical protein